MRGRKQEKRSNLVWRRAVVALLLVSFVLSMTPDVMAKRKTSGNFYNTKWSYNTKTKTLTLSCKGNMDDEYSRMNGGYWPWEVWGNEVQKIVIKEGVTRLGSAIADGCSVKCVVLPKSLKIVGHSAFHSTKLEKITLPTNLKIIEDYAFVKTKLKKIVIPEKTIEIRDGAFLGCKKLTKVQLPKKLKKISGGLFYCCSKLKTITLPKNITTIEEEAFYQSGLTTITIPKKVTRIKAEAFKKCTSLKKVTFETNKLTTIDTSLFEGCKKLTTITLPDSVTKLNKQAFKGSGLSTITIPEQVTTIGEETFANCKSLKEVVFAGNQVTSIGNNAFLNLPADFVFKVPVGQADTIKAQLITSGLSDTITVTEY